LGGDLGAAREGGYRVGGLGRPHAPPEWWCRGAAAGPRQPALAARIEVHFVCGCELASRFLAKRIQMSFSGSGNPPQSPPARAPHCALVGGYMRKERARRLGQRAQLAIESLAWFRSPWCLLRWLWPPRRFEVHFVCVCELASRFLAKPIQMSFAGSGNPPQSQPGRAPHCALVGGYVRKREKPQLCGGDVGGAAVSAPLAPLRGSLRRPLLVPFHTSPLSRGALRSAGVPTIAASTTPAPLQPEHLARGLHGIWEDSEGVREYPMCAEGWAMWVLGGSPDLFKATGGTCRLGTP
jgi:hypothetical protein